MGNTKTTQAPVVATETTTTCGIKSIQVLATGDSSMRYRVTLDTVIDGIKKNADTEEYEPAMIDYIDFVPRVLIAQCINLIDGLDLMYTKKKEQGIRNDNGAGFGAAELQVVLRGAKLDIKRTKFEAGQEYVDNIGNTYTHEHSGYSTDIVKIKVSDKVQTKLDAMIDSVFDI